MVDQSADHFDAPLLSACFRSSFLMIFSKSRMSASVSFPASASRAIMGCARPPKKLKNLVEQPVSRHISGDDRLKDVGIADLSHSTYGFFSSNRYTVV
jgi:hypothetical protein